MNLREKYNIQLKGCKFKLKFERNPINEYMFGDLRYKNSIYYATILYYATNNIVTNNISLRFVFRNIDDGSFILDKSFLRKKKLEKLMNEFKGKI